MSFSVGGRFVPTRRMPVTMPPSEIGAVLPAATASIPPRPSRRDWRSLKNVTWVESLYRGAGKLTRIVTTCSVTMPGSMSSKWRRLCTTRPAHTSSTNANAVSAITSERRARSACRPADAERPPSRNERASRGFVARMAGQTPTSRVVTTATPNVKASTRRSRLIVLGSSPGGASFSMRTSV
jgi:hypothetical protein